MFGLDGPGAMAMLLWYAPWAWSMAALGAQLGGAIVRKFHLRAVSRWRRS